MKLKVVHSVPLEIMLLCLSLCRHDSDECALYV